MNFEVFNFKIRGSPIDENLNVLLKLSLISQTIYVSNLA